MSGPTLMPGLKIMLAGTDLLLDDVRELRVDQHLFMPDGFSFRLADPMLTYVDDGRFVPGADVQISVAGSEQQSLVDLITGKVAAVEPEFGRGEAALTVRGYDLSHALHRTPKTRAFQNMTVGDIARKVVQEAGLKLGAVGAAGAAVDFVQQSNETDWHFLWRLAADVDFVLVVDGDTLQFQEPGGAAPGPAIALTWGETLRQLRPRVTGAQQVDSVKVQSWDPRTAKAISASVAVDAVDADIRLTRAAAATGLGGGEMIVVGQPVASMAEARAVGAGTAARLGNAYLEAEGVADGDPQIRAGAHLTVDGVGQRFGGTYMVTSAQHVYRGAVGYETRFAVSGRSPRTLLDLMSSQTTPAWSAGLVVGVVTNNKDPDGLGRVRVRFPALSDTIESWWARIAAPAAGAGRGVLMMPVAGDEVVVGFEHGDPRRPYVLGAVFNGTAKPQTLVHPDGSLHVRSDKEILHESTGNMTVDTQADLSVTVKGRKTEKVSGVASLTYDSRMDLQATGPLTIEGKGVTTVKAGPNMTVESQGAMTIKAGGSLSIECSGVVRVSGSQIILG